MGMHLFAYFMDFFEDPALRIAAFLAFALLCASNSNYEQDRLKAELQTKEVLHKTVRSTDFRAFSDKV